MSRRIRAGLVALEKALSIDAPVRVPKADAFLSVPDRDQKLGSRKVVFENTPFSPREVGQMGDFREYLETIRVRCTAHDADFDRALEIADAFKVAFSTALAAERKAGRRFGGAFDYVRWIDAETPYQSFDGRPGWEVDLEFTCFETVVAV